jgi:hypothetical protein
MFSTHLGNNNIWGCDVQNLIQNVTLPLFVVYAGRISVGAFQE